MYNWIDGRSFSGSKNLQALSLISRTFNPFVKNKFEVNSFKRLPVIKEEESNSNEDELEIQKNLLHSVLQRKYRRKRGLYMKDSNNEIKNYENILESKSLTRLPPVASINCLREAQQFWETKVGKNLLTAENSEEDVNLSEVSHNSKKSSEKLGDSQPSKFCSKAKSAQELSFKNGAGGKTDFNQTKNIKKKLKKVIAKDTVLKKKTTHDKIQSKKLLDASLSISALNPSREFLTDNIRRIVVSNTRDMTRRSSSEIFSNVQDLCRQKKQPEPDKEVCILCDKVFYNSQQFVQHLLTHETVDKITCKICKTNFLSLRKYRQHCKDFHGTSSDEIKGQGLEFVKRWLPKFECKRCKLVFDLEQNYEAHRRIHIKKDLAEEYFFSSKNM